jgi:hypothetical protein
LAPAYAQPFCKLLVIGLGTVVAQPLAVAWQTSVPDPHVYDPPLRTLSIADCTAAKAADSAAARACSVVKYDQPMSVTSPTITNIGIIVKTTHSVTIPHSPLRLRWSMYLLGFF